ncbi:MAG TPA: 50S ribosomal protein L25/general stress protein Ctc [Gammaproteobacteria bacterium]|nr:50S ribosomal protein L25/general stress protein Ctc [Gammaproteobacteria bacterium]
MKVDFTLNAESRSDVGKGASRRLRRQGKIPAVMYGAGENPVSLSLDHDSFMHRLEHEAFYSHILTITVDGDKAYKAVLKDLQRHPAKNRMLHADFLRVGEDDVIHMSVPLHFIGEDVAPGVKVGGLVSHLMTSVEIICRAGDLPEFLEVDLSALEAGESLHLSDIKLPEGAVIAALQQGEDHDLPVASIHMPRGATSDEGAAEGEADGEEASAE